MHVSIIQRIDVTKTDDFIVIDSMIATRRSWRALGLSEGSLVLLESKRRSPHRVGTVNAYDGT